MDAFEKLDEFNRRRNLPGVEVKFLNGKKCQDVILTLCGKEIGCKTTIFKRGKVSQVSFLLP